VLLVVEGSAAHEASISIDPLIFIADLVLAGAFFAAQPAKRNHMMSSAKTKQ
jgi:hypothetical protein